MPKINEENKDEKDEKDEKDLFCPVGHFFLEMEKIARNKSEFFDHLSLSRIEFMKAVRSLVDQRIERVEKKRAGYKAKKTTNKKTTKIKVE